MTVSKAAGSGFTVVTPCFNMGQYLEETIQSVLKNLGDDDQYFVIDGGSTDHSVDVIKKYASRITGWISEKDKGYSDALAKGFARSERDYQCWINCGDLLLPGALDFARDYLDKSDCGMIHGDDLYIDDRGQVIQVSNGAVDDLAGMMLYGGWTPLQDACFWRRSLYDAVGGISPNLKYAADFDLFLRMGLHSKACYVPAIFSAFRQHAGQTSHLFADAYRKEREECRLRELKKRGNKGCAGVIQRLENSIKVRWRARVSYQNRAMKHLVGQNVREFKCMPTTGSKAW